jgi:putative PIN family toxin of toxin-antitoxin system
MIDSSVVIDSNVYISALVFGGRPRQVMDLVGEGLLMITISQEMITEMKRKIVSKFPVFLADFEELVSLLKHDALWVELGSIAITACRDDDDNRILETAVLGNCDVVVSGDKDLLSLGKYEGIAIVPPAEFLEAWKVRGL